MKRLALALAFLCVAQTAEPRALVIAGRNHMSLDESLNTGNGPVTNTTRALQEHATNTLEALGIPYDVISGGSQDAKTEFCRLGVVTYKFGTSAAYTVSYDFVIHVGENNGGTTTGRGYRPDSLSIKAPSGSGVAHVYCDVPQIYMSYGGQGVSETASCSLGVAAVDKTDMGERGQVNFIPNSGIMWQSQTAKYLTSASAISSYPGGFRALVRAASSGHEKQGGIPTAPHPIPWPDSANSRNESCSVINDDSLVVLARMYNTISGAAPLIIVHNNDYASRAMQGNLLPLAIQFADSVMGGTILDGDRKPLKFGVHVRGGFSRGAALGWPTSTGGIVETDSASFIAVIDSIAAMRFPFAVGVNPDSLDDFATYDKRWWERAPMARYAVEATTGIDSAGVNGSASYTNPRDIFGLWRNRIAVGDGSGAGKDSSLASLVKGAFVKLNETFGASKVDHILIAPNDDWTPKNATSLTKDSLVYAMRNGGAVGVVFNPYLARLRNVSMVAVGGLDDGVLGGGSFKFITTPHYPDSGSVHFDAGPAGTGFIGSKATRSYLERMWRGRLSSVSTPEQTLIATATRDSIQFFSRARIFTVHAADLQAGPRGDASTNPARPGWWAIKWFVNQVRSINWFAYPRHDLAILAYPEDIEP